MDRQQILGTLAAVKPRTVEIEGIGQVQLRPMPISTLQKLSWLSMQSTNQGDEEAEQSIAMVCGCLSDEDGKPVIRSSEDEQIIRDMPAKIITKLVEEITRYEREVGVLAGDAEDDEKTETKPEQNDEDKAKN